MTIAWKQNYSSVLAHAKDLYLTTLCFTTIRF